LSKYWPAKRRLKVKLPAASVLGFAFAGVAPNGSPALEFTVVGLADAGGQLQRRLLGGALAAAVFRRLLVMTLGVFR
jgi:hypothetical protein